MWSAFLICRSQVDLVFFYYTTLVRGNWRLKHAWATYWPSAPKNGPKTCFLNGLFLWSGTIANFWFMATLLRYYNIYTRRIWKWLTRSRDPRLWTCLEHSLKQYKYKLSVHSAWSPYWVYWKFILISVSVVWEVGNFYNKLISMDVLKRWMFLGLFLQTMTSLFMVYDITAFIICITFEF